MLHSDKPTSLQRFNNSAWVGNQAIFVQHGEHHDILGLTTGSPLQFQRSLSQSQGKPSNLWWICATFVQHGEHHDILGLTTESPLQFHQSFRKSYSTRLEWSLRTVSWCHRQKFLKPQATTRWKYRTIEKLFQTWMTRHDGLTIVGLSWVSNTAYQVPVLLGLPVGYSTYSSPPSSSLWEISHFILKFEGEEEGEGSRSIGTDREEGAG